MFVKQTWYMAGWSADLSQDAPLGRSIAGELLVLFRDSEGRASAIQDRCPHRGVQLSLGKVLPAGLECGYHGMVFAGDGRCVKIPGQDSIPYRANVRRYPVEERDSMIWVWLGAAEDADPALIVDYPWHNQSDQWPHREGYFHFGCGFEMLVDNIMDLSHLGWVHARTIGGNPDQHAEAVMNVERTDRGVRFTRWLLNSTPPPSYSKVVSFAGNIDRWIELELVAPGVIMQYNGGVDVSQDAYNGGSRDGGFNWRILHVLVPETADTCHYFTSVSNGFRQDEPEVTDKLLADVHDTILEDKVICENQQRNLQEQPEPPLMDINSDQARVLFRWHLARLLKAENQETVAA